MNGGEEAMRTALSFIAKSVAVVFVALFVLTALLTLPLSTAGWRLFGPNMYKRALTEEAIYERAPALAGEQIAHGIAYSLCAGDPDCMKAMRDQQHGGRVGELLDPGVTPSFLLNLTQKDLEGIVADLAPPRWFQEQTESVIDQIFAYLNFGGGPEINVSLIAFKQRLAGEEGTRAFMRLSAAQPPCTPDQVALVESDADIAPEDMPICRPPEPLRERYADRAHDTLQAVAANFLDEVNVATLAEEEGVPVSLPQRPGSWRDDPRVEFQIVKWSLRLSFFVPLVLLLLATLAIVRSWRKWTRWWSISFLIVGVAGLLLALAVLPANLALGAYGAAQVPAEFSRGLVNVGLGVEKYIVRSLATWIAIESGVLALLGLLLLGLSAFGSAR
jgi:hypothetical protein